ncbi:phosphotransferase family protein [Rhabdothermincola sediminis]|uniref:phosphotransferase family protein n=1 Tax=Rhabdothermincola sediminis TaxID=2751370 RepID=UPI0027DA22C3|nr:phosphotransferase family protein [Rhabdothermincola sediminis]
MSDTTTVEGIDADRVTAWFERHTDAVPPLSFELITGGHSNLTFRVADAGGVRWVLRRPPLGQVLATAHDMGREHRILSALGPTEVPVPPVVGFCDDPAVNGAPFYVMCYVDGTVVRDLSGAERLSPEQRRAAGLSLIDTLALIHAVDVDAVGLGDLGRKEGYIERQLKRWYGQFQQSKLREVPVVDEVYEHLLSAIPEQGPATIVHGDYRLDNCLLGPDGTVVAVLDWEICTLGDPLADLGLLQVYWADPGEPTHSGLPAATSAEGFPTKAELLERYAQRSGRDLSQIDFYVAFGYWKLACIIEGVYARYKGGAMGDRGDADAFDVFGEQVVALAEAARQAAGRAE